jgi:hypothetical protein
MATPNEKIIDKLRKLLRQSEGEKAIGNTEAAALFGEKVQSLLTQHNLSMSDIELTEVENDAQSVESVLFHASDSKKSSKWQHALLHLLGTANQCKVIGNVKSNSYYIIGTENDRRIVTMLFVYFSDLAQHFADKELIAQRNSTDIAVQVSAKFTEGRQFKNSFLYGFATTVGQRILKAAETKKAEAQSQVEQLQLEAPKNALVRLDNVLAKIQEVKNREHPKLQSANLNAKVVRNGYEAGVQAGKAVALTASTLK